MRTEHKIVQAGKRFGDELLKTNMTLTELSNKTGIARSTLYAFIYDGRDLSCFRLAAICECLHISTDYILKGV